MSAKDRLIEIIEPLSDTKTAQMAADAILGSGILQQVAQLAKDKTKADAIAQIEEYAEKNRIVINIDHHSILGIVKRL